MTFPHVNRRTHLYLGLFLLPWFLMYGVSSVPFNHAEYFQAREKASGLPQWVTRFERPYAAQPPSGGDLRAFGAQLMREAGVEGAFGVYRQSSTQINVYVYSLVSSLHVKYFTDTQRLVVEDRRFGFNQMLTGMHARGGFEQDGFLNTAWGVIVDLVCAAMLAWIASGLYMWWNLPGSRAWGAAALAAGFALMGLFLLAL